MSNKRITRQQSSNNGRLRQELADFDPFRPRNQIFRSPSPVENGRVNTSNSDTDESTKAESVYSGFEGFVNDELLEDEGTLVNTVRSHESSLNLIPNPPIRRNIMAAQVTMKDALRVVQEFNGENIPLSVFFEGCDEALAMIDEVNEAQLTRLLRSKLYGEARKIIYGQTFDTVGEFKDYIKNIYAPAKTVHQLQEELGNEHQRDNENVISFAIRIRDLGRRIEEAHQVAVGVIDEAFSTALNNNMIECFKRGLKPEIEQRIEPADDLLQWIKNAIQFNFLFNFNQKSYIQLFLFQG